MTEQFSAVATGARFRSTEPVPAVVNAAFWILIAGVVLTAIDLAIRASQIAGAAPGPGSGEASGAVAATLAGGFVGVLIRIGVAVLIRRGYGPTRIYLIVVAGFSIMNLAAGILLGLDPIGALVVVSIIASVILVWLPPSSAYFHIVGEQRRQAKAAGQTIGFLG
jgi:hypothetical protein